MTIQAIIIADSISENSPRLTTFQLRYPRFIHAEELTHRILETTPELLFCEAIPDGLMYDQDLSRNASSSRAIPVKRMIEDLRRDPALPIYWGSNKPGMQAGEELTGAALAQVKSEWILAMNRAIDSAKFMMDCGLHKQIANRILEPWAHINVVVTATEWENFFALRSHPDAQPEIKMLSDMMQEALANSTPTELKPGEWHMPYIQEMDHDLIYLYSKVNRITRDEPSAEELLELAKLVSTARCARVSYLTHDGRPTSVEEDVELARKLIVAQPLHASPAEHQATPDTIYSNPHNDPMVHYENLELHGNFDGWIQHRKLLPNECISS